MEGALRAVDYRIDGKRFYLDGAPVSMFSGSFQYWRVHPDLWAGILDKVKGMGFDVIETYVPWSVHEVARGRFDFGDTDPRLDLPRFLALCKAAGVKVLVRPGPHINAELTYFGYPERLFADEELLARAADGTQVVLPMTPRMFPVPCYHHPRFQAEVEVFFDAFSRAVGGTGALHPGGPVMAIQVDNECSKFLRVHPFDQDYSEYAVLLYRRFLSEKYGGIDAAARAHRSGYEAWQLVDPPRSFDASAREELPRYLDWVEFGEYYINEALRVITAMLRERFGTSVPLFHNYPVPLPLPPLDMTGVEGFLDFQGVDFYPQRSQYHAIRWGMKYTSTVSRFPMLLEFSSGNAYYALTLTLEDQEFTTWAAMMHGINAINFYMIVERERWYGSPVKRDGTIRERHYEFYRRFLAEAREWGLEDAKPVRPVLLLVNREYERLAAAATLLPPNSRLIDMFVQTSGGAADTLISDEPFGLSEPVAGRYVRLLAFWYWALSAAGVHFAVGDTNCPGGLFSEYKAVIVPTFEYLDRGLQERLLAFAESGGALLAGPRSPRFDSLMEPCDVLAAHMLEPSELLRQADVLGVAVEELSLFAGEEAEPCRGRPFCRLPIGRGCLIQLGLVPGEVTNLSDAEPFGPLVDTLMRVAGVEPRFVPADARIDVSLFAAGGRTLVFAANPTAEPIGTTIGVCGEGTLKDMRTGASLISAGPGSFELSLPAFSISVLEQT
jgi:beta-galactosidase